MKWVPLIFCCLLLLGVVERAVVSGLLSHVPFNKLSVCHFLDVTMDSVVVVEDDNDELIMTTTADSEYYFYHRQTSCV